jgi:DNA-binding NarL/FixJ family response regulator
MYRATEPPPALPTDCPRPTRLRARAVSGTRLVRALSADRLPPPPEPFVTVAVYGMSRAERDRVLSFPLDEGTTLRFCEGEDALPEAAACFLVYLPEAQGTLDDLARARRRHDLRPAVVHASAEPHATSRRAFAAGAHFAYGLAEVDDLRKLVMTTRVLMKAMPIHNARRAEHGLGQWVAGVLGPCGVTPRKAQIIALHALGEKRVGIAAAMEISLKIVDEHIHEILAMTGQHRLEHVAAPFTERLRSDRSA